jgi:hypothetical protein
MWYKQEGCRMKPKDAESMEVDMETMRLRTSIVEKEWWGGKTARPRLTKNMKCFTKTDNLMSNLKFDFKFSKHVSKFRF